MHEQPDTAPGGSETPTLPMERLLYEVKKVIVGQDHLLERMAVALLARGHILVEGVPGLPRRWPSRPSPGPSEAISSASSSRRTSSRRI